MCTSFGGIVYAKWKKHVRFFDIMFDFSISSLHKNVTCTLIPHATSSHSLRSQVCVRFESHSVIDPLLHNEILMAALKN